MIAYNINITSMYTEGMLCTRQFYTQTANGGDPIMIILYYGVFFIVFIFYLGGLG